MQTVSRIFAVAAVAQAFRVTTTEGAVAQKECVVVSMCSHPQFDKLQAKTTSALFTDNGCDLNTAERIFVDPAFTSKTAGALAKTSRWNWSDVHAEQQADGTWGIGSPFPEAESQAQALSKALKETGRITKNARVFVMNSWCPFVNTGTSKALDNVLTSLAEETEDVVVYVHPYTGIEYEDSYGVKDMKRIQEDVHNVEISEGSIEAEGEWKTMVMKKVPAH